MLSIFTLQLPSDMIQKRRDRFNYQDYELPELVESLWMTANAYGVTYCFYCQCQFCLFLHILSTIIVVVNTLHKIISFVLF